MAVIYKSKNNKNGFLLISTMIILSVMIVIVNFYLNGIIQEEKINYILQNETQAYYLAESGVQEAFWKLQNDSDWKQHFEDNQNWQASFNRSSALIPNGSYEVDIANTDRAAAIITATSTIAVYGTNIQRVVQTSVFKALNQLPTNNIAIFSDGDIASLGTRLDVTGGDIFTNKNITLVFFSDWNILGNASAVNAIDTYLGSELTANNQFDKDHPPVPAQILMPQIDFDSSDQNSLKSLADQTYTAGQFSQLLKDSPNTTLNGITYVTGNVHIKNGDQLTINGALIADGSLSVGNGGEKRGAAILNVNHTIPRSGIMVKKNIIIGGFATRFTVNGLVYAGSNFRLQDGLERDVVASTTGGIIAQSVNFYTAWDSVFLNYNQTYVNDALGTPLFSPVLLINHWEEEY